MSKQVKLMLGEKLKLFKDRGWVYNPDNGDVISSLKKLYQVSKQGDVIRISDGHIMCFSKDNKGYLKARLKCDISQHKDGRKPFRLHRIVAMFYLENYSEELQVNHIDGNKTNNHIDNLEMVTNSQNVYHAWNILDSSSRKALLKIRKGKDGKFKKS